MSFHSLPSSMISEIKDILSGYTRPLVPGLSKDYLTGLRGIFVIQSFVWLWIQTFVPALALYDAPGPPYQDILRKVFSALLWNQNLIFSFFIVLSARTCSISFLTEPTAAVLARSLVGRPIRIGLSISLMLAISIVIFSNIDTSYIDEAAAVIGNPDLQAPMNPKTSLAAFNVIYNLLWVTTNFPQQGGNMAWPSGTMWAPSLIYFQSYTVYFCMIFLPFTRANWHVKGLLLFSAGSFWFNSWGWFSAAGLFIADVVINPELRKHLESGPKISESYYFPYWILATMAVAAGVGLQYFWTAALPDHANYELVLHPSLDWLSNEQNWRDIDTYYPYPRLDIFCIVVGCLFLVEMSQRMQSLLACKPLVFFGRRSLSIFAAQALMIYTVGLKLFLYLYAERGLSTAAANAVVLIVLLPTVMIVAEIFYRMIDRPSRWASSLFFQFLVSE